MKLETKIDPIKKPIGIEPLSPIKILEGVIFQYKKPRNTENKRIPMYEYCLSITSIRDNTIIPIEKNKTCTAVIPSIPSIKLNTFITHIHNIDKKIYKTIFIIC
tara:strand:- start:217 stop:528 length:312 start_codon:yes stop_codon:yes gene_type:complete